MTGYRSSSGSVIDYEVRIIGTPGYHRLIAESLEALNEIKVDLRYADVWKEALDEQRTSWQKSLDGTHAKRADAKPNPDVIPLYNLQKVSETVREDGETKVVNSSPKTLAKKAIVKATPMGTYIGLLNLSPDKLESIELI